LDDTEKNLPSGNIIFIHFIEGKRLLNKIDQVLEGKELKDSIGSLVERYKRCSRLAVAMSVFGDETHTELFPPSVHVNISKVDVFTWVSFVASDYSWCKNSTTRNDVLEGDVFDVDEGFGLAVTEWVGHAAWTLATWFLHLLRTNVNIPPNWEVDGDVVVHDVSDLSCTFRAWICLDIEGFERILKLDISELDSSDATMVNARSYRPKGHTYTKFNVHVLNENVLRATVFGDLEALVGRLHSNSIIKIGNVYVSDGNVGTLRVNTVSIKRESWKRWSGTANHKINKL